MTKKPGTIESDEAKNAKGQFLFFGQAIRVRFAGMSRAFLKRRRKSRAYISFEGHVKC